jgi:adenylate kinase family enzyme
MSAGEEQQTIAVLGPPAAGKTTVARLIAAAIHGRYLSIVELRRVARREGWLPADDATPALVAAALRRHALSTPGSLVVLDDVVTDAAALDAFAAGEPAHLVRPHVIEFDARDLVLFDRALRPRCPLCHHDPDADQLQPAPPEAGQPASCASCGGPLFLPVGDEPGVFQQRLAAYREHHAALSKAAARHGVRWTRIEADEPPDRLAARAVEAITRPPGWHGRSGGAPAPRRPTP